MKASHLCCGHGNTGRLQETPTSVAGCDVVKAPEGLLVTSLTGYEAVVYGSLTEQLENAFERVTENAQAAFGNGAMLVEELGGVIVVTHSIVLHLIRE